MDIYINLGLLCLMSLTVVCQSDSTNTTTNATSTVTSLSSTTAPKTTTSNGTKNSTTLVPAPTSTPASTKSTTPASITCFQYKCPRNCSTVNVSTTCTSDTSKGCKTVINNDKSYSYNCSTSPCEAKSGTICCFKPNCNTYGAAQQNNQKGTASSMFGNLVWVIIIMMAALYFL